MAEIEVSRARGGVGLRSIFVHIVRLGHAITSHVYRLYMHCRHYKNS